MNLQGQPVSKASRPEDSLASPASPAPAAVSESMRVFQNYRYFTENPAKFEEWHAAKSKGWDADRQLYWEAIFEAANMFAERMTLELASAGQGAKIGAALVDRHFAGVSQAYQLSATMDNSVAWLVVRHWARGAEVAEILKSGESQYFDAIYAQTNFHV